MWISSSILEWTNMLVIKKYVIHFKIQIKFQNSDFLYFKIGNWKTTWNSNWNWLRSSLQNWSRQNSQNRFISFLVYRWFQFVDLQHSSNFLQFFCNKLFLELYLGNERSGSGFAWDYSVVSVNTLKLLSII